MWKQPTIGAFSGAYLRKNEFDYKIIIEKFVGFKIPLRRLLTELSVIFFLHFLYK